MSNEELYALLWEQTKEVIAPRMLHDQWPRDRFDHDTADGGPLGVWRLGYTRERQLKKASIFVRPLDFQFTLVELEGPAPEEEQACPQCWGCGRRQGSECRHCHGTGRARVIVQRSIQAPREPEGVSILVFEEGARRKRSGRLQQATGLDGKPVWLLRWS